MKIPELKKCPFCGTNVNYSKEKGIFGWHDTNCFLSILDGILEGEKLDIPDNEVMNELVKAWNRRVDNGKRG